MPGVYISWPFCAQKCTYCNFASGVHPASQQQRYLRALTGEIARQSWPWTPETVYLGGGTPSQMSSEELDAVLSAVPGAPWRECTLEAAPGALDQGRIRSWKQLGVNRVSLGVQSFVEKELRQTGRRHSADVVAAECELLRAEGIDNFNIDLIAGLPFQSEESWEESLSWVARLAPPHVSVYMLEVDEDSRLGLEILGEGGRYGAGAVPSDEVITANYLRAVEALRGMGIPRYEISNFARPGSESIHNLKYWRLEPYLGFGVDAHSCSAGQRWGNVDDLTRYLEALEAGQSPSTGHTPLRPVEERYLTGLRLDAGIAWSPGDLDPVLVARLRERIQQGLLDDTGARLRLTNRGVLLSNEVFEDFLEADATILRQSPQ
ncbi:MAG: radical SAM family heme chaperone HemW [Bryobacterales bacterium]|nr:radical SAM family heme chaperone HemW [Bryobacterales bacterium]